jgi:hypothetical protein
MNSVLLLAVLAQVATSSPSSSPQPGAPQLYSWSDGKRSYKLYESFVLVAEPSPDATRGDMLKELGATVVVDRPTMRIWKVSDAAAVRKQFADLRPVFHDSRALMGRYRVPLALVCGGKRVEKSWLEVLQQSSAECLPDFWYPPVLR